MLNEKIFDMENGWGVVVGETETTITIRWDRDPFAYSIQKKGE